MKLYIKYFVYAVICFSMIFGALFYSLSIYLPEDESPKIIIDNDSSPVNSDEKKEKNISLSDLYKSSGNTNVVLFGTDGHRADTIVFLSYNPKTKKILAMNIPRDTYYHIRGYDKAAQKKINAAYKYFGSNGFKSHVSNLMGVEIDHYIKFDYESVSTIVDAVGGVSVDVPFDMKYDDPLAEPELHIDIKKGYQVLDGEDAVDYLRFRKNNDGSISEGDMKRLERQKQFLSSLYDEVSTKNMMSFAKVVFNSTETDIELSKMVYDATKMIGVSFDSIDFELMPGRVVKSESWYYLHDPGDVVDKLKKFYRGE